MVLCILILFILIIKAGFWSEYISLLKEAIHISFFGMILCVNSTV